MSDVLHKMKALHDFLRIQQLDVTEMHETSYIVLSSSVSYVIQNIFVLSVIEDIYNCSQRSREKHTPTVGVSYITEASSFRSKAYRHRLIFTKWIYL